ncbi:MAG TPA: dihydrolipoamide acetyltransferase family protein [Pseudolabrys sp.]|nr:dihydrolipoamide acetyltransferase family protein [Pseudolabrys sp.]
MSSVVVMPKVGLTMTEGKIVEWRKSVGQRVEKGEIIFVFETEKVSYEVDSTQAGFLTKVTVGEGETVPVGAEVAILADTPDGGTAAAPAMTAPVVAAPASATTAPAAVVAPGSSGKVRATPLARRIAKTNGIDIAKIAAANPSVRLKKKDVESFVAQSAASVPPPPASPTVAPPIAPAAVPAMEPGGRLVKLNSMREIIARKMLASTVEAAQAYMVVSVDAGNLVDARKRLIPSIEKQTGIRPTVTDLLVKIVAVAIEKNPIVNTRWTREGIVWLDKIHLGLATALDDGLVVPVISDVGSKKLSDIAVERQSLVALARAGKLPPEQMSGSTFTISSLGMFGVEEFSAIINQPESAILAVGAILDTPVAREGAVVIRPIMKLTLTYDHRIIDGAKAAAFIGTLKDVIEEPLLALA